MNKHLIIAGSVLLTVVTALIIAVIILSRKRKAEITVLPKQTTWGKELTESESAEIKRIADALYEDMHGLNIFGRNHNIYTEYNNTTDRVFVGVANYFAETYGKGETLAKWIKDENFSWNSFATAGLTDSILARLAKFGIK